MAILFRSCFGLNSLTTSMEWDAAVGATIATVTLPSGNSGLAGKISSLASGVNQRFRTQFKSAGNNGPFFFKSDYQVTTLPSAENRIFAVSSSSTTGTGVAAYITIDNSGFLRLYDSTGVIGSPSAALSLSTWYRIEILFDRTAASGSQVVKAMINGVLFASGTTQTIANSILHAYYGGNLNSEAQTTGVWYFANIGINDNTGSFERSYVGPSNMIHLNPNAAGDSNSFAVQVGGTIGGANNYTRVNEIPPNDATSYNGSAVLAQEDLFKCAASGVPTNSVIRAVMIGVRMADLVSADATTAFKVEVIKASGGTKTQSGTLIPNSTTWKTNATAAPLIYPIIAYNDPDGNPWTQATLDTLQVGYALTATNVQTIAVSNIWALVEYTSPKGNFFPFF